MKANTAILQSLQDERQTGRYPSILRDTAANSVGENTISSVARRHARAAEASTHRTSGGFLDDEFSGNNDEDGDSGLEYATSEEDHHATSYYATKSTKDKESHRRPPSESDKRRRLYVIARGKGGLISVGFYREAWDDIEFLVDHHSKGKYTRVHSEHEGMKYLNKYFHSRDIRRPKWLKEGVPHYPHLSKIRRHLGISGEMSTDYSSGSSRKNDRSVVRVRVDKVNVGPDPSVGKDSELFDINIKSVTALEKGLAPENLGKRTVMLFLEQIDDMTAYPRLSREKNSDSIGDLVTAVSDLHTQKQDHRGGAMDTGWKNKNRNVLMQVKNAEELNTILSYLLEEQHNILETFQGDCESVLLNAHVDDRMATTITVNSLALRIGRDTLYSYIGLLNHLLGVHNTLGWDHCRPQVEYHGEKLNLIRGKYRNRIQMVCKTYIYLRDGQANNWLSLKIQQKEIANFRTTMKNRSANNGGPQAYSCSHCKSALHGGGRSVCPWKNKTATQARSLAAKALVNLAGGDAEDAEDGEN
jgi:hypothetical protein